MRLHFLFILPILVVSIATANADMIVTVSSKQIAPESLDFVDVFVSSTVGQNVKLASYQFSIAGIGVNTSQLEFRDSFDLNNLSIARQSNSEQLVNSYLFSVDNAIANFAANQNTALTLTGADESTNANGVDLVANQSYLLARLELRAIQPGQGTFTISMIPDTNRSYFEDKDGTIVPVTTFNSGTLSITAVPEPASWMLIGTALAGFGLMKRRRARAIAR